MVVNCDNSKPLDLESSNKVNINVSILQGNPNWYWSKAIFEGYLYSIKTFLNQDFVIIMNDDISFERNFLNNIIEIALKNKREIILPSVCVPSRGNLILSQSFKINGLKLSIEPLIFTERDDCLNGDAATCRFFISSFFTLPYLTPLIIKLIPHYLGDILLTSYLKYSGFTLSSYRCLRVFTTQDPGGYSTETRNLFWRLFAVKSNSRVLSLISFWFFYYILHNLKKINYYKNKLINF